MSEYQTAAQIAHRITCDRCRMGWTCGGVDDADYELGGTILDLVESLTAKGRAEVTAAVEALLAKWQEDRDLYRVVRRTGNPLANAAYASVKSCGEELAAALTDRDALRRGYAAKWDQGYACGLGDCGKGNDETVAFNPYQTGDADE